MRVLLASGSSGGHIFPALALMDSLKEKGASCLLVLPRKCRESKLLSERSDIEYIASAPLSLRLSAANIYGAYSFLKGSWESLRIVLKFRPDAVIGFGSLYTVALLFWAWLFRIKTMIHEQNLLPGRANRLLCRFVDRAALSFGQTKKYLRIPETKMVVTGNPIRRELARVPRQEALDFFKFKEGKFNILIAGGSQGSQKINSACSAGIVALARGRELQVIHISGFGEITGLESVYTASGITHKLFDFLSAMQYAYSAADLAICRAGATTIAELEKFGLPAILIPYPFAYSHQLGNARVLEEAGSAKVILDSELTSGKLKTVLEDLLADPGKLRAMARAYDKIQLPDAAGLLAQEVLNLTQCAG
ncbi:MAG: undecaprenyldiphospho-muramoylpentapeptide beta-N-acetylglucosaminyltransferase [Candidatus Omnitrophica bacterium]|nr:undecaprenyldiphospho-muramoylpentapeptide beta-N-acetylglucosaminyltransferase [Candidatus Omnitrophota bacterium]